VVSRDGGQRSLVFADIPGLIEGAHDGAGLGHRFLRHIERCRVLLHLVDLAGLDGVERQVEVLSRELELHDPDLARRRMMLVGTKLDALSDPGRVGELSAVAARLRVPASAISAVTGEGLDAMLEEAFRLAER
jgi:GTP-binding protein